MDVAIIKKLEGELETRTDKIIKLEVKLEVEVRDSQV